MAAINLLVVFYTLARVAAAFLALLMLVSVAILAITFLCVWRFLAGLLLILSTLLARCMEDTEFAVVHVDDEQRVEPPGSPASSFHSFSSVDTLPEEVSVDPVLLHTVAMNKQQSEKNGKLPKMPPTLKAPELEWQAVDSCNDAAIQWEYSDSRESKTVKPEKKPAQTNQASTQKRFIEDMKSSKANFSWTNTAARGGNQSNSTRRSNKNAGGLPRSNAHSTAVRSNPKPGSYLSRNTSEPAKAAGAAPEFRWYEIPETKQESAPAHPPGYVAPHLRIVARKNESGDLIPGLSASTVEHSSTPSTSQIKDLFDDDHEEVDYPVLSSS